MPIEKRANDGGVDVTFQRLTTNGEVRVAVVGDFNAWSTTAHPMQVLDGGWSITVTLDTGLRYRFRYLVDGERWENDWSADDYVDNAFGGQDSVVDLTT